MKISIDATGQDPIYKQIVKVIEKAVREQKLAPGQQVESMNELADRLNISKETVKKAYGILADKGIIVPKQGKGFYAADLSAKEHPHVLVLFDKFSVYKQAIYNALAERLGHGAELTIHTHNQSLDLLEYYLNNHLDLFDFYVVTPHFPLDENSQARAVKLLSRIPNRKLILLDRLQPGFPGNFGAVYQDFESDIYGGLAQGAGEQSPITQLRVITLPTSLYGSHIRMGVERFAMDYHIPVEFMTQAPSNINKGDTFLVLNSQLDAGLVDLVRKINESGLSIGSDVRIIAYNDFETNELVLGGLTTVSTDFREMGYQAAEMILERKLRKVHCPFKMIRRRTF